MEVLTRDLIVTGMVLAGICGFAGPFVLARRLSFMADTLAHSSLTAVGIALFLGVAPEQALIPFCVGLALLLTWLSRNRQIPLSTSIAVAFSFFVGTGTILLHQNGHDHGGHEHAHNLEEILFGSLENLSSGSLTMLTVLAIPAVFVLWKYRKPFMLAFIHEGLAHARGVPVTRLEYVFVTCLSIIIAVTIRLAGVLLVTALLTVPALIAARFSRSLAQQLRIAPAMAMLCAGLGMAVAMMKNLPTGACISSLCGLLFAITMLATRRTHASA